MKISLLLGILLLLGCSFGCDSFSTHHRYFGQTPPGMVPELFAPGIVSSEHQEHSSLAISPDGKEMYWSIWRLPHDFQRFPQVIMFVKFENGAWSEPQIAPFSGTYRDGGPAFSLDGDRIYFYSRRPVEGKSEDAHENDIWYVERVEDGWSEPVHLGDAINSASTDATPSLAANGNMYFTTTRVQYEDPVGRNDIFFAECRDEGYLDAIGVGPAVNTDHSRDSFPFIAPDESYLLFSRDNRRFDAEGNVIEGDRRLMVSFKGDDGEWMDAVEMGPTFHRTRFPSVSPDGKYLFFTKFTEGGHEDFYWVDAQVIENLRLDGGH